MELWKKNKKEKKEKKIRVTRIVIPKELKLGEKKTSKSLSSSVW